MSGHLCVGCHREEAGIREKKGHRLRFCGKPCQSAFYSQPAPIGYGLLDDIGVDVLPQDLTARMEAVFRPYAGPDLPGILVTAVYHGTLNRDALPEAVVAATSKTAPLSPSRLKQIFEVLFKGTFLGWSGPSLMKAMFDHALDQPAFASVAVAILTVNLDASWALWNMPNMGDAYDAARVAHIFSVIEARPLHIRQRAAITLVTSTIGSDLRASRVHFARLLLRLCVAADMPDQALTVMNEGPMRNQSATMHELILVSGEAGARRVFGEAVTIVQEDIDDGRRNPTTDRTVLLAREMAKENGWQ